MNESLDNVNFMDFIEKIEGPQGLVDCNIETIVVNRILIIVQFENLSMIILKICLVIYH